MAHLGDLGHSVIRRMTQYAEKHGATNLSQGFPNTGPPDGLKGSSILAMLGGNDAGIEMLLTESISAVLGYDVDTSVTTLPELLAEIDESIARSNQDVFNQYSVPYGLLSLREAISRKVAEFNGIVADPEKNITVTCGATEALFSTLTALIDRDKGEEVVVFQPFHEMYPNQLLIVGGTPRYASLKEPDWDLKNPQWQFDREELNTIFNEKTTAIILTTPHNPSGKVFSDDDLMYIADLCIKHDTYVITDEIYEHMTYDGHNHVSMGSLDGMEDRTITINAISKTYSATGLRVGWVIAPEEITDKIRAIHDTIVIQAPTPIQKGTEMALGKLGPSYYQQLAQNYKERRDILLQGLTDVGFRCANPEGSYYLFADFSGIRDDLKPMEFAMLLTERALVTPVPGDNFYATNGLGDNYVRFAFAREHETLERAVSQLRSVDLG